MAHTVFATIMKLYNTRAPVMFHPLQTAHTVTPTEKEILTIFLKSSKGRGGLVSPLAEDPSPVTLCAAMYSVVYRPCIRSFVYLAAVVLLHLSLMACGISYEERKDHSSALS